MFYKMFVRYWKICTWYLKPIGPYYRWLWRSPGKKFLITLGISLMSVTIQIFFLDRWLFGWFQNQPSTLAMEVTELHEQDDVEAQHE